MPREALRSSIKQHKAKNLKSKNDDLNLDLAMRKTKKYLEERFSGGVGVANFVEGKYYFEITKKLDLSFMIENIKASKLRAEN